MTLIVARKMNGKIFVISDTLLTDPIKIVQDWHKITPKILVFDDIVVAFSGVIEPVLAEWGKLPSDITLDEVTTECLAMIKRYDAHISFIVIRVSDSSLVKINSDSCKFVDQAWLGSGLVLVS